MSARSSAGPVLMRGLTYQVLFRMLTTLTKNWNFLQTFYELRKYTTGRKLFPRQAHASLKDSTEFSGPTNVWKMTL